ncbi:MAG TPA: cytochrome c [Ignavibacteria bacterium]|nr:cytochrome c [Ignavibacteria bacterium]HQY53193.1 cytochrome c [Ignavibacteria bacterium]HRB01214.1 cytochrome c [Ignavibacteria bacterium]
MNKQNSSILALIFIITMISYTGCGGNDPELGIGPVKEIKLEPAINENLVATGKQIFDMKCITCHQINSKLVGPPLKDVTKRRKPEWIMNMILNPVQMVQENMIAKTLATSGQYPTPMTFQNVSQDDARAILEYFRNNDK